MFFANNRCLTCKRELGFLPDALTLVAIERSSSDAFTTLHGNERKCAHYG